MPLLRNDAFVTDAWEQLGDDMPLAESARAIVSLARLKQDWDQLARHTGLLGVVVPNTTRVDELAPYFSRLGLVVLPFPTFADGRAYSLARQLRLRGYRGELRATGNILPDQLQFMLQVGIESFEVPDRFALETWQKAARMFNMTYQRGLTRAGNEREVWSLRHQGFTAWEEQPHAG
jgi:uncharacterized protein (DUF934 family)